MLEKLLLQDFYKLFTKKKRIKQTEVLSPTFNLLYEYDLKIYKIMHYDLYRLKKEKELNNLGIFRENQNVIKLLNGLI